MYLGNFSTHRALPLASLALISLVACQTGQGNESTFATDDSTTNGEDEAGDTMQPARFDKIAGSAAFGVATRIVTCSGPVAVISSTPFRSDFTFERA